MESQLAEQGEVIQSLFDAFRVLVDEGAKKEKRIEKLEQESREMKEFVFLNIVEGLNGVRGRVEKFEKVDSLIAKVDLVQNGLADVQYVLGGGMGGDSASSPSRRLVRVGEAPARLASEQIQPGLDKLLSLVDEITVQRNSDVELINSALDRLDSRVLSLAASIDTGSKTATSASGDADWEDRISDIESDWAAKWASVAARVDLANSAVDKLRGEFSQSVEKSIVREGKILQIGVNFDHMKKVCEKLEFGNIDLTNKLSKIESSDIGFLIDEIKRIDNEHASVFSLEAQVELSRAECKSNWERTVRICKQDLETLRVKVDRLTVLKDEVDRIAHAQAAMHIHETQTHAVRTGSWTSGSAQSAPAPSVPAASRSALAPDLTHAAPSVPAPSTLSESSLLSLVDESIGTQQTILLRLSADALISVPTGGSEIGTVQTDGRNRLVWRIENMAAVVRDPNRFPKIFVSPQFESGAVLVGRLKLFPQGSDQSRIDGHCSLYLRCLPGVVVRFAVDIGGEVIETFECEYEKQRDKGKHDFVKLNEYIDPDGSLSVGIEIRSISITK